MELLASLCTQVRANRLANHRLHDAVARLDGAAYEAPRTGFFPSLRTTLEHILAVDRYYLAALRGEPDTVAQWAQAPRDVTFEALRAAQVVSDERLIAHLESLTAADLDMVVELDRGEGVIQREQRGHVIAHLLAHQVHHRGQAHAMLSGTDVKPPQLDEFLMPSEAPLRSADLAAIGRSEAWLFRAPVGAVA